KQIKEKIEKIGTPLREWDINIYRGVLTGYNEAFIIDSATRDKLISVSPNSAEIIRPILRGRDIKRYGYESADLWLLFIPWHFPLHKNSLIKGASEEAEDIFKRQYPAIYNHLLQFKTELSNRNKAETGIRYEWYALQRWGANYWEDFFKPKIIYPEITKFLPFYYDEHGYYINNKCFMITSSNISFLTAFFNSSLFKFCFRENFPELLGGTRELRKVFFDKIPVIKVDENTNEFFREKIILIQELKAINQKTTQLENEIDTLIFDLYNLSQEERKLVVLASVI
ncbi:hypothetical protein BegalDRAFT_3288, partial [Beggiatoa alba B18LD]